MLLLGQFHVTEKIKHRRHVHAQQFMDILSPDLDIQRLLTEPAAAAFVADGLAGISVQHVLVLNLVSVRFHPTEELVKAYDRILLGFTRATLPDLVPYLLAEVAVRLEYGNLVLYGIAYYQVLEPAHLFAPPARDRSIINGLALVRNHQILTYADDLSQTAAHRTGSERTVEAEQILVRFGELHSISLEPVDELPGLRFSVLELLAHIYGSVSLVKSGLDRRMQTRPEVLIGARQSETVNKEIEFIRIFTRLGKLHDLLYPHRSLTSVQSGVSFFLELKHELDLIHSCIPVQVRKDVCGRCSFLIYIIKNIGRSTALDFKTCDRRICTSDTGIYHAEIVIDLGAGSYSRTWISCIHLLLYRNRRRYALDQFHIRLGHPAQELTGIRGKALGETPLALCKKGIEGKR